MKKKTPTENLMEQVTLLPPKDASLAVKFIQQREFEKLHELVNANIIVLEKKCKICSLEDDDLKQELTLTNLCRFKNDIEQYLYLLGWTNDDIDDYADDSDLIEESYYTSDFYD